MVFLHGVMVVTFIEERFLDVYVGKIIKHRDRNLEVVKLSHRRFCGKDVFYNWLGLRKGFN